MQQSTYEHVVHNLHDRDDARRLATGDVSFSVTREIPCSNPPCAGYDSLISILSGRYKEHIKKQSSVVRRPENIRRYLDSYRNGKSIVDIAEETNFSPFMMAREITEGISGMQKKELTTCMKDPERIADERLRDEVMEAIEADEHYGPSYDTIRHVIGHEYEYILQQKLRARGIPFVTEEQLRQEGFPKTPDVKLEVPVEVDGHIINWIDSKALFGDEKYHNDIYKNLRGYVNRFGPGMVLYWFGFVETANNDADIYCVSDFPSNLQVLGDSYQ